MTLQIFLFFCWCFEHHHYRVLIFWTWQQSNKFHWLFPCRKWINPRNDFHPQALFPNFIIWSGQYSTTLIFRLQSEQEVLSPNQHDKSHDRGWVIPHVSTETWRGYRDNDEWPVWRKVSRTWDPQFKITLPSALGWMHESTGTTTTSGVGFGLSVHPGFPP